ncbi:hypothetical protein MSAN_02024900 [Mycena sanguinolenta]|uniref:LysM domain-containing protein n=1 Tax=Mycena sanguinolenta TaxID=230812 RepID=A0A8H7CNM9_9AGAR|nr:hypothetical protein MSAN_02024900 [Mycena sanguinolenta]
MLLKTLFALLSTALAVSATPLEARSCSPTYTVKPGDTCSAIATAKGLTLAELYSYNPSINSGCTNLAIGEVLCLGPGVGSGGTCTQTYTVKSGDTCSAIAAHFGLTVSQLLALNPSISSGCTNLAIGQVLCVASAISSSYTYTGIATYYTPNGGTGACPPYNSLGNNDFIVALGSGHWNGGSHCGETMTVTYGSKTINVVVQDLCPGCQGANGIDLTPGGISQLDSNYVNDGHIDVTWTLPTSP